MLKLENVVSGIILYKQDIGKSMGSMILVAHQVELVASPSLCESEC